MLCRMFRVVGCGVLLATAGCAGGKFQPVKGQVVYTDGTPVTGLNGGQVVFRSVGSSGSSLTATGPIDAEGRFTLGTDAPGDGAVVGKHQVVITPPDPT